jgi:hypothetical protein
MLIFGTFSVNSVILGKIPAKSFRQNFSLSVSRKPVLYASVADQHRKNADADPGKNLYADAIRIPALTELWRAK